MSRNQNLTQLDTDQIIKKKFDENNDADRVYIVGGEHLNIQVDTSEITNSIKQGLKGIKFESQPAPLAPMIHEVEKTVFIPQIEIREIEKQVIVPQIEYRTIEIPVITERVVTVDRPVIVTETKFQVLEKERFYPALMQICAVIQAVSVIGLLIWNILKK